MKSIKSKMMKMVLTIVCAVAFSTAMVLAINAPKAGSDCPNGCQANGDGCYCNAWYPCYKEAQW